MTQSTDLLKRVALAFLGQALPEKSALHETVKQTQKGLLATVVTGVLLASFLIFGCYGFYLYLISEGLSRHSAIILGALFLLMLTIISALIANNYLSGLQDTKEKLSPFSTNTLDESLSSKSSFQPSFEQLIQSFWDGFNEPQSKHPRQSSNVQRPCSFEDSDLANSNEKETMH